MRNLKFPEVPTQDWSFEDAILRFARRSGVYFAFDKDTCVYVGSSLDIGKRLNQHNNMRDDLGVNYTDRVRVIEMPEHEMYFAECYFIGVCGPTRNIQGKKTDNAYATAKRLGML